MANAGRKKSLLKGRNLQQRQDQRAAATMKVEEEKEEKIGRQHKTQTLIRVTDLQIWFVKIV